MEGKKVIFSKKSLTIEKKQEIWRTIWENMIRGDRDPYEVIEKDYKGDEGAYLLEMAGWLGVPL